LKPFYVWILTKNGFGPHFGRFLNKLIWSPWCGYM
jgi:hypothetical protein